MKNSYLIGIIIVVVVIIGVMFIPRSTKDNGDVDLSVTNFDECVEAGYPVMESYPRQCATPDGVSFTEFIGNEVEMLDMIVIDSPRPNSVIESPLKVTGEARGQWFFEADFPLILTDWDGKIIAEGYAQAQGEWMTVNFVPFEGELEFEKPEFGDKGTLILKKQNAADFDEEESLEIPVLFSED